MEDSILTSTKKILGIAEDYTAFDLDIITHINSTFSILNQLGVGTPEKLSISDEKSKWEDLGMSVELTNLIKTYVFLKVRLIFDPPSTSFHLTASKEQVSELESRINYYRELEF